MKPSRLLTCWQGRPTALLPRQRVEGPCAYRKPLAQLRNRAKAQTVGLWPGAFADARHACLGLGLVGRALEV